MRQTEALTGKKRAKKLTKRWRAFSEQLSKAESVHPVREALDLALKTSTCAFDEALDVAVRLGVDVKQSDQQLRGSVALPHGLGKEIKLLAIVKGPQEEEAKAAGADFVGSEEFIEKIKTGWLGFDKVVATPDMMPALSKVAKILGPRGLMPNPKVGTVTKNVAQGVKAEKAGKLGYRTDKAGIVHASVGRRSMGADKLQDNLRVFIGALLKAKPAASKGVYFKSMSLSSTQGPGFSVDVGEILKWAN